MPWETTSTRYAMNSFKRLSSKLLLLSATLLTAAFYHTASAQPDECSGVVTNLSVYLGTCGGATSGTTIGATQSMPSCNGSSTADDDVWFRFVAPAGGPVTVTVNGGGGAGNLNNPAFEVFSGTCGSLTSILCRNTSSGNSETGAIPFLTPGNTYYIRVYSAGNGTGAGAFDICLTRGNPPANDEPTGATSLTPSATCGTGQVGGNLVGATNSGIVGSCTGTLDNDVWYRFVAQSSSHMISLNGLGSSIVTTGAGTGGSAQMEVFISSDNTPTGTLTSLTCAQATGTNTMTATYGAFVPGNTYFVRVFSTTTVALTSNANFNICVTNPPANDNCSGAISLTPATNCTTGSGGSAHDGTLINAGNSGIASACGAAADDDVWYSFTAQYVSHIITLSNLQANIAASGSGLGGTPVIEVFSSSDGTCSGTFASMYCGGAATGNNWVAYVNSLTVGNTYFVRVYSSNNVRLVTAANFRICITNPPTTNPFTASPPTVFFGKSFINITKGNGGGTVETGDILEVRAAITLRPTTVLDSCSFTDNIPAGVDYVPGSLAILTNEGKVYKSFTDAPNDDEGYISGGVIRINLGFNQSDNPATPFRRGRLKSGNIPTVGGSHVILVSYRVQVTAPLNTIINLGGGTFTYSLLTDITNVQTHNFNNNNVKVYTNTGLCPNATGVNVLDAGLAGDFSGTFGQGNTINRVPSPNVGSGYEYVTQTGSRPGDFTYTVTNNMSNNAAGYSTSNNWPKPESPAVHRIFGVWDVIGDHTNAADPLAGNPAADTTNGGQGGYMLLVNAAYTLDTVFVYPISGLCPNTYYEISFWVRNVCSRCGMDSLGRGASGVTVPDGYIPTAPGDSSGVYPNLSFSINGVNHYTTGNMTYTGQWVQKGFVFKTEPGQTDIVFAIANNAPGGGGNDWALDDIRLATCTPNLNLVPVGNSNICINQQLDISADVVSYFDNYTYYQWQVSHDNGATFNDTLSMGVGTPVYESGNYVYNAAFPSFIADSSQHRVQYRIRVATDPANLYGGCSFYNGVNIIVMVNNCEWILNANLISFDAVLKNRHAVLTWKTNGEESYTRYDVQRSSDGINFFTIATVEALDQPTSTYTFTDPDELHSYAYYRIVISEPGGQKISPVRLLSVTDVPYEILSAVNPFHNKLSLDVSMPQATQATIILSDQHGRRVKYMRHSMTRGLNKVVMDNLGSLPAGTYILQVVTEFGMKSKRVIKLANR